MRIRRIGHINASELCLGGGKLVDKEIGQGKLLVEHAMSKGITIVDAHHRYGNAEEIFGQIRLLYKMTKVSAYMPFEVDLNLENSIRKMCNIDILWVSDLDDINLYTKGEQIYNRLSKKFPMVGITTESPLLATKFLQEHPECKLFMIPFFPYNVPMERFIQVAKKEGKYIFVIKPFDDGRCLKSHSVYDCLKHSIDVGVDVIVFGTGSIYHIDKTIEAYNQIVGDK